MAPLRMFALVFASQLMLGFNAPLPTGLPPPSYGTHTTILSIDGGGIRGIIPATVFAKDPTTSLADYFDVIAGTSTGGLISVMLSAPKSSDANRPVLTPPEIIQFFKDNDPKIFDEGSWTSCPVYDGKYLKNITRDLLKGTRLSQSLTKLVITSFDDKKIKPITFSSYKLKSEPYLNATLSDISLATSAAPSYLPRHQFENNGYQFSMIDGAMAANNPAMVAVSEVMQHSEQKQIMLLSLGTGIPKKDDAVNSMSLHNDLCKASWLLGNLDVLDETMFHTDQVHHYLATVFPGLYPLENYLRIEEYNLYPSIKGLDNANKENMENLEKVGKPVAAKS
ncbi:hypothetical protein VNO78_33507 [Psophocarpus tetragonolobus]|uniref:Patatin n=1 Tax=Psophocarpus tetragonolobus TaxID=3891 RepID=A0AAN9NXJ1_PSOTE